MLYVITDTHFGHKNMIPYCGRPQGFTDLIIKNCQKMLTDEDTLIHLGDVAWGDSALERFLHVVPGQKILVRGNHGKKSAEQYMAAGFQFVAEEMTLDLHGIHVLFSHRPKYGHSADINIHGHLHNLHRNDIFRLYWPLSLEHMGYRPIALNDDVLHTLSSWVHRRHVPTMDELLTFRQTYLGEARAIDYIGSDENMGIGRPLTFYTDSGDKIDLCPSDFLRFRFHVDTVFLALHKSSYDSTLATLEKKINAILLPWNAPQFEMPYPIIETKQSCIKKETSPFREDVVCCWLKLKN